MNPELSLSDSMMKIGDFNYNFYLAFLISFLLRTANITSRFPVTD